ncbi:MAG: YggS family pyridoxal phosphate-dependent enzyme [Treponemataceae bacterium]
MENIKENILKTKERIELACSKSGRKSEDVKILLATKTRSPETIIKAFDCGIRLIGENRAQELVEKYDALKNYPHENHFIGHLQSNKIKSVIDKVSCIESVDSFKLAEKINNRLVQKNLTMKIFVEVNTSGEESKHGCTPEETLKLIEKISKLSALKITGLMTIGALTDNEKKVRNCFVLLRNLAEKIKDAKIDNVQMQELSMGMSSDFEWAIEEGATEIRLGSTIFGARP